MSHFRFHKKTSHKRRPTESSGGLWILIHSTDGPFTCRNLWKRFLNPSKAFLDTWKTHGLYLYLYSFHKKRWGWHLQCDSYTKCQCHTLILPNKRQKGEHFSKYSAVQGKLLGLRWGVLVLPGKLEIKNSVHLRESQKKQEWAERNVKCACGYHTQHNIRLNICFFKRHVKHVD